MSPIQQMLLGVGAVDKKTYIDDIFSTFLYKGTGSAQSINNGIDLSSEGGMVWIKQRTGQFTNSNFLFDTKRGTGKYLKSDSSATEDTSNLTLSAFNSNGFSVGSSSTVNLDFSSYQGTYNSWSFRKAPGFLDIIEWSGNGANRLISHNLGSVPGMVIVKCTSHAQNWQGWHKSFGYTYSFAFNREALPDSGAANTWNSTDPTATHISVGPSVVNASGKDYVAYIFAGGESTAATAVSVDFNGTSQYLSIPTDPVYDFGTGDFTVEAYINHSTDDFHNEEGIVCKHFGGSSSWRLITEGSGSSSTLKFRYQRSNGAGEQVFSGGKVYKGQWTHVAVARNGTKLRLFVNGLMTEHTMVSDLRDPSTPVAVEIGTSGGRYSTTDEWFSGKISNVRIVKGTAVYTSSFQPSTTPLTSITNTKLLCCQSSTVTTATTITGSITNNSATASTDSPFDDPAGFVFGDAGDQNVIKMGKYTGNGSESDGTEVFLGWEPTWLMVKRVNGDANWGIIDTMRGWTADGAGNVLFPNRNNNEDSGANAALPTSTGFKLHTTNNEWNGSNDTYMYVAIRRPDGYVGKPVELGTGAFATDTAAATTPNFDSGFPVDFTFIRTPASNSSWYTGARLISGKLLHTNTSSAQGSHSEMAYYDFNEAYGGGGWWDANVNQAWMWKRHAGFDVVCYEGNQTNRDIKHSMGIAPTMVWLKSRTSSEGWVVGSSGLSSWAEYLTLNNNDGESTNAGIFNSKAPTATHFSLGTQNRSNESNQDYIAFLFASVSGISSVGSYTGNGQTGSSGTFVTTGFQPRLVWVKRFDGHGQDWPIYDSLRGFNADTLYLNELDAATAVSTAVEVSSTGFRLITNNANTNGNTDEYIYYAHA